MEEWIWLCLGYGIHSTLDTLIDRDRTESGIFGFSKVGCPVPPNFNWSRVLLWKTPSAILGKKTGQQELQLSENYFLKTIAASLANSIIQQVILQPIVGQLNVRCCVTWGCKSWGEMWNGHSTIKWRPQALSRANHSSLWHSRVGSWFYTCIYVYTIIYG